MSLIAISYPELEPDDMDWIQRFRSEHDSNYNLLGPHFTLVFPTDTVERDKFIDHVRPIVQQQPVISFVNRCATVVPYRDKGGWHIFLVPDEGFSEIVKLHDRLYTGSLAGSLRMDLNFIPHMTVGFNDSVDKSKALADELNAMNFQIAGHLTSVDIADYDGCRVESIERVTLSR